MNNTPNPEFLDEENPEWTQTMLDEAKTAAELFPHLFKPSESLPPTSANKPTVTNRATARNPTLPATTLLQTP